LKAGCLDITDKITVGFKNGLHVTDLIMQA